MLYSKDEKGKIVGTKIKTKDTFYTLLDVKNSDGKVIGKKWKIETLEYNDNGVETSYNITSVEAKPTPKNRR